MSEEVYMNLQTSERAVATMASTVFSAFVTAGQLKETNEDELIERSVSIAIKIAQKSDKLIDSDDENKRVRH